MSKPGEFAGQFDGSVHAPSPEPDPDGAKFHERDAAGNLVEVRPKHHVDPLAKTEAVSSAPQERPKTLLERLQALLEGEVPKIVLVTKSGDRFEGVLHEVTEELIVLKYPKTAKGPSTILTDRIESFSLVGWW